MSNHRVRGEENDVRRFYVEHGDATRQPQYEQLKADAVTAILQAVRVQRKLTEKDAIEMATLVQGTLDASQRETILRTISVRIDVTAGASSSDHEKQKNTFSISTSPRTDGRCAIPLGQTPNNSLCSWEGSS